MSFDFAVSNVFYATSCPDRDATIERIAEDARANGFGVEWWAQGWGLPPIDDSVIKRIRDACAGMPVSLHTEKAFGLGEISKQIDMAARIGARVQVVHSQHLVGRAGEFADDVPAILDCARDRGVKIALENAMADVDLVARLLEDHDDLGFCYGVGHGFLCDPPRDLDVYLSGVYRERLCHLHLQDTLTTDEVGRPGVAGADHFLVGAGGISHKDWDRLGEELARMDFTGTCVFEVRPRSIMALSIRSRSFLMDAWKLP